MFKAGDNVYYESNKSDVLEAVIVNVTKQLMRTKYIVEFVRQTYRNYGGSLKWRKETRRHRCSAHKLTLR